MSLWQLHACIAGWNKAQGGDKPDPMEEAEFDAAVYRLAEHEAARLH